ncbi:universal stress protein [Agromyces sp. Marseille-P2726]|uniref:universal stress protein n=1 Tax=Agromyces sp. Marseille-P2726 TaxID=2709132 RepID=UPI001570ECA0|nr:universal stress protein [Agromyces sp. Marseille-P2726]
MFTRVIAGWDGTAESQAAVEWAADRYRDLPLMLIHAIGGRPTDAEYQRATGELSAERTRLIDVAEQLRATHPGLHLQTETAHGSAIEALEPQLGPDTLVVVGGPDHPRATRWTLGSRLAGRRGGGTVAVVPAVPATERPLGVVVGVDGSHASLAAVELAAAEADRLGSSLEVVHAWQIPQEWDTAYHEYSSDVATLEEIHHGLLDDAIEFAHGLGASPTGRLEAGRPTEVLRRLGADSALLVVASHGARGLSRFFLGSVSHDLLVEPPSPVLIVAPRS